MQTLEQHSIYATEMIADYFFGFLTFFLEWLMTGRGTFSFGSRET